MDDKSVKKHMRKLREKENLSQLETAEKLGMSLRSYNSLETGNTRIFNRNLEKFADLTGSRLEELILGDESPASRTDESEEFSRFREMHLASIKKYEDDLCSARVEIATRDKQIEDLKDHLKDKEKLIKLLEKQLDNG